ncbi:MAG: TerC family protein [Thermodesulfovibrionales bacterium]|nr:TerC family protein [Thermodesulfovibrionales bacterium]
MFEWIFSPEGWIALITLVALETVLGVDNIIFITILVSRLPEKKRDLARRLGLSLAMVSRLLLLFTLSWIMGLTQPLFSLFSKGVSGRDIILILGGIFLLAKATHEIHTSLNVEESPSETQIQKSGFYGILLQVALIDIVFSLDSVITAVGLVKHISIMVIAIIASVMIMMVAAKPIGNFVDTHPTIKMLALSFLILIGFTLVAEGMDIHIPKGYIYFAMLFSVCVEMLNIKIRKAKAEKPIKLSKKIETV